MHKLPAVIERLDEYITQRMQRIRTPGLALALTDRERLLHVATYGLADRTAQQPVAPATLFEIGSIGKSFTSIALLQEHTAGRLDLHAPITRYLPWFSVQSQYAPITAHDLLSHTSGLPAGTDFAADSRYEVVALRDRTTGSAPGQHFYYSNVGYKLLGWLLEALTGQRYGALLQTRILTPLGMRNSTPTITNDMRRDWRWATRRTTTIGPIRAICRSCPRPGFRTRWAMAVRPARPPILRPICACCSIAARAIARVFWMRPSSRC